MKPFMDEDFLLQTPSARRLYHDVAERLPIIDYHCHLNPAEIAADRRFCNISEAWLYGDHYKWRAMRLSGMAERDITGPADDYSRFLAWSKTIARSVGNPLFHWTHLELKRYFGIDTVLSEKTAADVWQRANQKLAEPQMSARGLIRSSNVQVVCTTDDPADDLGYHAQLAAQPDLGFRVLPAFRPDRAMGIEKLDFAAYLAKLGESSGCAIAGLEDLLRALRGRMDHFAALGCKLSDHGFEELPFAPCSADQADALLQKGLKGQPVTAWEAAAFKTFLLLFLGREYARRGWVMQLHIGASRNNNTRMFERLGPDTGYDAVADGSLARNLSGLLNALEQEGSLPRTILYTLNPKDNYVIASLAGCFQQEGIVGKVQFGAAWWYVDHKLGMEQHMRDLASIGQLSGFLGMLTDSRSFLSYTRHEYFRRILCNLIGQWVEDGECPGDSDILEPMVRGICYENARTYFNF